MTDIAFHCELCGEVIQAEAKQVGQLVSCPKCGASVRVSANSLLFRCPKCGRSIEANVKDAGQSAACPTCSAPVLIPIVPGNIPSPRASKPGLDRKGRGKSLTKCSACGGQVSEAVETCPHCGHPFASIRAKAKQKKCEAEEAKASQSQLAGCLVIFIILVIAGAVWWSSVSDGGGSSGPEEREQDTKETHRISGDNWFGCTSREYFSKLGDLAVSGDEEAYRQALIIALTAGTCTTFQTGEIIYLIDAGLFSGVAEVRRAGETQEYWTNMEAVK